MVLFDKGTIANLLPTASLHITQAIFTDAGLTKLSRCIECFALAFSKQQKKKHALLLYYGNKLLLQK